MPVDRELPPDWRERTLAMIRGAEPISGAWFTGGPVLGPEERLGIYAEQYRLRMTEAVRLEIAGLAHLLGDAAEEWIGRYVAARPSTSWTLHRVADRLPAWLAEAGAPVAWVEMAELDRAVNRGFEAEDEPPVRPERLVEGAEIRLQAHVSLLRLGHNVHEIRSAALSKEPVPELRSGSFPVVVFRRETRMRHWEVPVGLFALLEVIAEGRSVGGAIDAVYRSGHVDLPTLQAEIGGWFRELSARSLVSVGSPSQ